MAGKSHVLVFPYPVQGHINPMLQFSKRLASKGLRVTLLTTTVHSNLLQDQPTSSVIFQQISDGFNEGEKPNSIDAYVESFKVVSSQDVSVLIENLKNSGHPVRAIVYDSFTPWILDIAKQFGLYGALFFTHSCAVSAIYYHTHQGSVKIPLEEGSVISLPSIPPLEVSDLLCRMSILTWVCSGSYVCKCIPWNKLL